MKMVKKILSVVMALLIILSAGIISSEERVSAASDQHGLTVIPWDVLGPALDEHLSEVSGLSYWTMMCAGYVGDALNKVYRNTGFSSANTTVSELHRMFEERGITVVAEGTSTGLPALAQPGDIIIYYVGAYQAYDWNTDKGTVHVAILGDNGQLYHSFDSSAWNNSGPTKGPSFYDWAVGNIQYNKNYDRWRIYRGITPPERGSLELKKSVACDADLVAIAPISYSLGGAEYTVYTDEEQTEIVGILTTDKSGASNVLTDLEAGVYYAKETKAPNGFALDPDLYSVELLPGETAIFEVEDRPMFDPINLLLKKEAVDKGNDHPIEGAIFEVSYYDGIYWDVEGIEPLRTWKFKTDAEGKICFSDRYYVGGDELFRSESGNPVGLIGSYLIREIEAPEGYALNSLIHYAWVRENGKDIEEGGTYFNPPTVLEDSVTGSLRIRKVEAGTEKKKVIPGVSFQLHQIIGEDRIDLGEYVTDKRGEIFIGQLPLGKYELVEKDTAHGYLVNEDPIEIEISGEETYQLVLENEKIPELKTSLTDRNNGEKDVAVAEKIQLTDKLDYRHLIPGEEYLIRAQLIRKSDSAVLDQKNLTFTPDQAEGSLEVDFETERKGLEGESLIACCHLLHKGRAILSHYDYEDEEQTFSIPRIGTQADIDAGKSSLREGKLTLVDRVSYSNLIVGKEYRLEGRLMDKETGLPLVIEGEEIIGSVTFTPEQTEGEVDMIFSLDSRGLEGLDLVVFEDLYREDKLVAIHADIEDEEQTVKIPKIATVASIRGKRSSPAQQSVKITDRVSYANLQPGKEYLMKGVVMDKLTGQVLIVDGQEVRAEKAFIPDKAEGQLEMTFTFNGEQLGGRELVVFEECLAEGRLLAFHKDLSDEGQTVTLEEVPSEDLPTDKKKPKDHSPNTGDRAIRVETILLILSLFVLIGLGLFRRMKVNNIE